MKTIEQFCSEHSPCSEGLKWALANCKNMQEVWSTAKPEWLLWVATRPGVLTERELRLFAVYCARSVQRLLTDPKSIKAIDVAERYANDEATEEELAAAWAAARDAVWTAASASAWTASWTAAWTADKDAAMAADRAAAWAAASAASWDTASTAQAEWFRNNTQPNFL